jgi:hypothetical protein
LEETRATGVLSIRATIVLAIVAAVGVSGFASAVLVRDLYDRSARAASEQVVRGAAAAYEDIEQNHVARLSSTLVALAANPTLREAFLARDRDRLYTAAAPIFRELKASHGITHFRFIEPEPSRRCFLRVHAPSQYGDVVERATLAQAVATGHPSSGKELGRNALALRVVRPLLVDGRVAGYLELGEEMDHFLLRMKARLGDDLTMFVFKQHFDLAEWTRTRGTGRNSWDDRPDVVVVNSTTSESMVDDAAVLGISASPRVLDEVEHGSSVFVRGVFPVRGAGGNMVGGVVVRHDITALHTGMLQGRRLAFGLMIGLAAAAAALVYLLLQRLVFRRLQDMIGTMKDLSARLAGGDYDVGSAVCATGDDEVGRLEAFFGDFLRLVGRTLRDLSGRLKGVRRPG